MPNDNSNAKRSMITINWDVLKGSYLTGGFRDCTNKYYVIILKTIYTSWWGFA